MRHRPAVRQKTLVAATRESPSSGDRPSSPEPGTSWRMFSYSVTQATLPSTVTSSSVKKNWMYGVLAKMARHELRTFSKPRSVGQPGCVTATRVLRSHTSPMAARSRASKAP